jgi:PD-(D/E)XK nuclease superfamily
MTFDTVASLRGLGSSEDLRLLELSLAKKQTSTLRNLQALEDSTELVDLENLRNCVTSNVFEIIEDFGWIGRNDERLHTRFLEFFTKAGEKRHALSDKFVKALLKKATFWKSGRAIAPDLRGDFSDTQVLREKDSGQGLPDLMLINVRQKVLLIIENKVRANESQGQLKRYWEGAEQDPTFAGFAIGGLFLTPDGRNPVTAGKYPYGAISYAEVAHLLNRCARFKRDGATGDMLVNQYVSAVRRWFVEDPKIEKLAWRIYMKYPSAVDYLESGEGRPWVQINNHLRELIISESRLRVLDNKPERQAVDIWFILRDWDEIPKLRHAHTLQKTEAADDRLLIFWFYCSWYRETKEASDRQLGMYLGTVNGARASDVKNMISVFPPETSSSARGLKIHDSPQPEWTHLWARRLLTEEQLRQPDRDLVLKPIDDAWQQFLKSDLPKLEATIKAYFQKPLVHGFRNAPGRLGGKLTSGRTEASN